KQAECQLKEARSGNFSFSFSVRYRLSEGNQNSMCLASNSTSGKSAVKWFLLAKPARVMKELVLEKHTYHACTLPSGCKSLACI
ncbi:MAG TPA: hypothetical protein VGQ11_11295, partial [Candidatus Acidoferrales bacterium]|nr:hypothetical protein [Candidatus Acidoferrales bacterium]